MSEIKTVGDLIELLKTVPPETKLVNVDFARRVPNRYSYPEVFVNCDKGITFCAGVPKNYKDGE